MSARRAVTYSETLEGPGSTKRAYQGNWEDVSEQLPSTEAPALTSEEASNLSAVEVSIGVPYALRPRPETTDQGASPQDE